MGNAHRVLLLGAVAALFVGSVMTIASAAPPEDKEWVCHATGSEKNPYVVVHVAKKGWEKGHDKATHHANADKPGAEPKGPTFKTGDRSCPTTPTPPPDGGGDDDIGG